MSLSWLRQRDLILVLVPVIAMVTSSTIELTEGNACSRMENYTVTLKERYAEPIVVNTFSWCFQIPPRCPRTRIEMRERWRIKTETRQRRSMDCCEGYVAEAITEDGAGRSKCVPRCEICEYGRCVAPNTCVCEPGHRGEGCAHECPAGSWGERCSRRCDCESAEICNPVDGECHCPPGWQGYGCKEKCPAGTWGIDCSLFCACKKENDDIDGGPRSSSRELPSVLCNRETGVCINFVETIVPFTSGTDNWFRDKETGAFTFDATIASVPLPSTKESTPVEATSILCRDPDNRESGASSTSAFETSGSSETSVDPMVFEIGTTERSGSAASGTVANDNGNYDRRQRIDAKEARVGEPSTTGPVVAVVRISGNGSPPRRDGPVTMTSMHAEKVPTRVAPMPLDAIALIVIGSILSLGLTTLAVLAVLRVRSRLFETIRLSIYDAEKREATSGTLARRGVEKGNGARTSSMGCGDSEILACEYETPRCIIPEHRRSSQRPRPSSDMEHTKKQESNYSNDYPNIRLFGNLQELLEAHYDRPPSTFRQAILDVDGEHLYDEIPLQSSATFTGKRDS